LKYVVRPPLAVAYHAACSLQHGQKITVLPKEMLSRAGFAIKDIPEGHICCGSAGTYNLLQPELANRLRDRKIAHIQEIAPDLIAAGNIGCITQIAAGTGIPVVHPIELIDWATGGPAPRALESKGRPASSAA
jgi:glycolate oxidase iron-sulfur subunit